VIGVVSVVNRLVGGPVVEWLLGGDVAEKIDEVVEWAVTPGVVTVLVVDVRTVEIGPPMMGVARVVPTVLEAVLADPLLIDPLPADPVGIDPVPADPVTADPVGIDPLLTDPLLTEPAATDGLVGSSVGVDSPPCRTVMPDAPSGSADDDPGSDGAWGFGLDGPSGGAT
jgi:hypothetical protein